MESRMFKELRQSFSGCQFGLRMLSRSNTVLTPVQGDGNGGYSNAIRFATIHGIQHHVSALLL